MINQRTGPEEDNVSEMVRNIQRLNIQKIAQELNMKRENCVITFD
jgi:hypothetical protein